MGILSEGAKKLPHVCVVRVTLHSVWLFDDFGRLPERRLAYLVHRQFESIVQHSGKEHFEQVRAFLEARIGVGLDQPGVELPIDDVVVAKYFKALAALVRVQLLLGGFERELGVVLDLCQYFVVEEGVVLAVAVSEVLPEICKTQLVAILKVTVSGIVLLYRVVGEVHPVIREGGSIRGVLARARPDVALSEEKAIQVLSYQHPHSDVELSALDEQRVFNVFLNDKLSAFYQILVLLRTSSLQLRCRLGARSGAQRVHPILSEAFLVGSH